MPRGGRRRGTPGKAYTNRTDMAMNYDNTTSAASGGAPMQQPPQQALAARAPEDSPMLTDPTQRPDEPITAGLPIGPGPGPVDPRRQETIELKKYLPLLELYIDRPETPDSVRSLFTYIRGA